MTGPRTAAMLRWFAHDHLPDDLQTVSAACSNLAETMADHLPESPELTAGLRKLLEAKDCFVRAAVDARGREEVAADGQ